MTATAEPPTAESRSSIPQWRVGATTYPAGGRTLIVGILNVTPDSFSDGGEFFREGPTTDLAIERGLQMVEEGADIIDVGGESTRPGSVAVSVDEELARVLPAVRGLAAAGAVVSVDTSKSAVAAAALDAGAAIVNDVSGLRDPAMARVVAERGAGVVIMHMAGTPQTMQIDPTYDDVVGEVRSYLVSRAAAAEAAGIDPAGICIDPGIGFGKTLEHNLVLLGSLDRFVETGYPVLLGASRKGFLGEVLRTGGVVTEPGQRDRATAATTALAVAAGVRAVRVHDVSTTLQVVLTASAIVQHR